jgi:hypothetical protein
MGLDGDTERNFGETFDIVWRLNLLDTFKKGQIGEDIETTILSIKERAYAHLRRLFRGTDGTVPGVFYPKDSMTYYLGQVDVWRKWDKDMIELDEDARMKEHRLERSAKINPLRPDHRRVAQKAVIQA